MAAALCRLTAAIRQRAAQPAGRHTALAPPSRQLSGSADPTRTKINAACQAAMRAMDARAGRPQIGRAIGGLPDLVAEGLCGDKGMRLLQELATASHTTEANLGYGMALRTEIIDGAIMARRADQLVLLAPGLDARAWRLPMHTAGTTVFEVDDAAVLNLKHSCIEDPSDVRGHVHVPVWVPLSIRWVPVAGDIAHPSWPGQLLAAGFDPARLSTMVLQGMWEVPTVELLGQVSGLLSPGSAIAGDVPFNLLDGDMTGLLAKFGTRSASEVTSVAELETLLAAAGLVLRDHTVVDAAPIDLLDDPTGDLDDAAARRQAEQLLSGLDAHALWPADAVDWVHRQYRADSTGATVARAFAMDVSNFHGLAAASTAQRARVVELMLANGLTAKLDVMVAGRAPPSDAEEQRGHLVYVAEKPSR